MNRKTLWITLGVALLVAGITAAWTQAGSWHGGQSRWWFRRGPVGYVARELDLSDNQRSQIKTIWEGERPNIAELAHQLASEQKEMDALTIQNVTPDEAKVQDIAAREGVTIAKLLSEKQKITAKIYTQVLTSSQRAKANGLLKRLDSHLDRVADRIGNGSSEKYFPALGK
jgi:Spy/CpxP family protein refolding chaperone